MIDNAGLYHIELRFQSRKGGKPIGKLYTVWQLP